MPRLRSTPGTQDQARFALQCDRFRLRFSLLALRLNHATPVTTSEHVAQMREVEQYASETLKVAQDVLGSAADYKGRTVDRTNTFLESATIPSVKVIRAGALVEIARAGIPLDHVEADIAAGPWRTQQPEIERLIAEVVQQPDITFRVHYNLACFWARVHSSGLPIGADIDNVVDDTAEADTRRRFLRPGRKPAGQATERTFTPTALDKSYSHLRTSLGDAPYYESGRLALAASTDPALKPLRDDTRWNDLVELLIASNREIRVPRDDGHAPDENES